MSIRIDEFFRNERSLGERLIALEGESLHCSGLLCFQDSFPISCKVIRGGTETTLEITGIEDAEKDYRIGEVLSLVEIPTRNQLSNNILCESNFAEREVPIYINMAPNERITDATLPALYRGPIKSSRFSEFGEVELG